VKRQAATRTSQNGKKNHKVRQTKSRRVAAQPEIKAKLGKVRQTRSRRVAAQPEIKAKLRELKRSWKSLSAQEKAKRIGDLDIAGVSDYGIGASVERSPSAIRRYHQLQVQKKEDRAAEHALGPSVGEGDLSAKTPTCQDAGSEKPEPQKRTGRRDVVSRLAAVIVNFLRGRRGAPAIPAKDVPQVVIQALIRFSCELHDPIQVYLPSKVSIAEVIRRTKPKAKAAWAIRYYADWLASIMISMAGERSIRMQALEYVARKINLDTPPARKFEKLVFQDPRDDPDWDQLKTYEQEFRMWARFHG
jgi:hypothetical protein